MTAANIFTVIPGRDEVASPESITTIVSMDSGYAPPAQNSFAILSRRQHPGMTN
jgi:hypothetical protein